MSEGDSGIDFMFGKGRGVDKVLDIYLGSTDSVYGRGRGLFNMFDSGRRITMVIYRVREMGNIFKEGR